MKKINKVYFRLQKKNEDGNDYLNCSQILSTSKVEFSTFAIGDEDFPKKAGLENYLSFSQEQNSFFVIVKTSTYIDKTYYYLQCPQQLNLILNPLNSVITEEQLDKFIKKHRINLMPINGDCRSIDFQIILQTKDKTPVALNLVCDESFIDKVFVKNPGISSLLEKLLDIPEDRLIQDIVDHLQKGLLNPAREEIITRKNELRKLPGDVQNLLFRELFLKRGFPWIFDLSS